jgi:hypothetical protein
MFKGYKKGFFIRLAMCGIRPKGQKFNLEGSTFHVLPSYFPCLANTKSFCGSREPVESSMFAKAITV